MWLCGEYRKHLEEEKEKVTHLEIVHEVKLYRFCCHGENICKYAATCSPNELIHLDQILALVFVRQAILLSYPQLISSFFLILEKLTSVVETVLMKQKTTLVELKDMQAKMIP